MNAFQSLRERDNIKKAVIFFPLTALLATVAGLITHFDAPGHATGLPVTDMRISGMGHDGTTSCGRHRVFVGFTAQRGLLSATAPGVKFRKFMPGEAAALTTSVATHDVYLPEVIFCR